MKPGPPEIVKVEGMKEMLKVDLRRNRKEPIFDPFMCQIRYQATTKDISVRQMLIDISFNKSIKNRVRSFLDDDRSK